MKKYQIFISSTFTDLKDERRVVVEQLLNLGHIPVGMEIFQAANVSQWEYIKKRIAECDYYIVILGDRYGSVDQDGMSYTEKEYRLAAALSIPTAAFLMSAEARALLPRAKIETNKKRERQLAAFRDLCQKKMAAFWSNPHELAAKVSSALLELIEQNPRAGLTRAGRAHANTQSDPSLTSGKSAAAKWIKAIITEEFKGLTVKADSLDLLEEDPGGEGCLRVFKKISLADAFKTINLYQLTDWEIFDVMRDSDLTHQPTGFWEVFQRHFERKLGEEYLTFRQSIQAMYVHLNFDDHHSIYQLVKELEKRSLIRVIPDKNLYDWDEFWIEWSEKGLAMATVCRFLNL